MILTQHGINSIRNLTKGLIYYSNFANINGMTDTPKIGSSINYRYTNFTNKEISNFQPSTQRFLLYQSNAGSTINDDIVEPPCGTEVVTAEYFLVGKGAYDFGCNLNFLGTQDNFNALTNRYLRISGLSSLNIQTFNGAEAISEYGYRLRVPFDICPNGSIFHRTIVATNDKKQYHYVNGLLVCINESNVNPASIIKMGRFVGSSDLWIAFTNLAIWNENKANSDMMTYPVPTKPYIR